MTDFNARIARAKPGSLMADGSVIDWAGKPQQRVAWVPYGLGVRDGFQGRHAKRNTMLNDAGWRVIHPRHYAYPGIPPNHKVFAIFNINHVKD